MRLRWESILINTKNFKWDMAFNFSKIDNYVDELAPGVESIFLEVSLIRRYVRILAINSL